MLDENFTDEYKAHKHIPPKMKVVVRKAKGKIKILLLSPISSILLD